jgi:hypothetical protein
MSRLTIFSMIMLVIIFLGLAACGGVKPTTDPSMFQTNAWQTVAVAQAQTALAASATPSSTYTPPVSETQQDTVTPLITNTPLPGAPTETVFSIKTATPRGTQSAACDNANFVKDITIPDFAEVPAGSVVIKTWAFKNLGPCTWTVKYHLVFSYVSDSGKDGVFSPPAPVPFPNAVLPGEELDISVTFKAPTKPGTYQAVFVLQNENGFNIPLINMNAFEFFVIFVVK